MQTAVTTQLPQEKLSRTLLVPQRKPGLYLAQTQWCVNSGSREVSEPLPSFQCPSITPTKEQLRFSTLTSVHRRRAGQSSRSKWTNWTANKSTLELYFVSGQCRGSRSNASWESSHPLHTFTAVSLPVLEACCPTSCRILTLKAPSEPQRRRHLDSQPQLAAVIMCLFNMAQQNLRVRSG